MAAFSARIVSSSRKLCAIVAASILALLLPLMPVLAQEHKPVTMATLLDRIQIENLLTRYYYDLSMGKGYALAEYFTSDALLDVDGTIARGHKEIEWTGVMNEGVGQPPSLFEQGREYSEHLKIKGKWLISTRCISSDCGTPDRFDATYKPGERC